MIRFASYLPKVCGSLWVHLLSQPVETAHCNMTEILLKVALNRNQTKQKSFLTVLKTKYFFAFGIDSTLCLLLH